MEYDARLTTVYDCTVLELAKHTSDNGNLTVVQPGETGPFPVRRVYYLYDIPGGSSRGGHAHYELQQLIVAAGGSFEVMLDDGVNRRTVFLNQPYYALNIVPGIWRELHAFSSGAVTMVLASELYARADYMYQYKEFISWKSRKAGHSRLL